jgi:lysophospholipase L1-like esterase
LRRSLPTAFVALAASLLLFLVAKPADAQDAVRIMPLGDSITGSPGCWRALLWNQLQDTGHTNIDFVGTLGPQGCGQPYDGDNEGHGGALVTTVADQNQLPGWLSATNPDVVLMHFGTNDVWSGRPTSTIIAAYDTLVDQMRADNPGMTVLVAQIIPMDASACRTCPQGVVDLNAAIPSWATGKTTAQSPVVVVDQWTGFSTSTDTYDGVHPNDGGNQKISDRWYPALAGVLDGTPPPSSSPPPSSPPPPSSTPPPVGSCAVSAAPQGQWDGGYVVQPVAVTAGSSAIGGWTVTFTLPAGHTIVGSWNASFSVDGQTVTAANLSYNGNLGAGANTTFGFQVSRPNGDTSVTSGFSCASP